MIDGVNGSLRYENYTFYEASIQNDVSFKIITHCFY